MSTGDRKERCGEIVATVAIESNNDVVVVNTVELKWVV
jgi:hypothetical protein